MYIYVLHFKSFSCVPISLNVVPVLFLWHRMPLLMHSFLIHCLFKSHQRHAVRRFVHCELRKRARNTRLDSGCCHRRVDNRMGSSLVGEYVSQTTSVLCSVLKVCVTLYNWPPVLWRCFVFLDITEEMFLATDLVLSLQWSKTLQANYKTYSHWCSKSTAARQCTQVLIPIMTIISSDCIPSCEALGIDD